MSGAVKQALEILASDESHGYLFVPSSFFPFLSLRLYYTRSSIRIEYKDMCGAAGAKEEGHALPTNQDRQGLDLWLFWFHPQTTHTHTQSCPISIVVAYQVFQPSFFFLFLSKCFFFIYTACPFIYETRTLFQCHVYIRSIRYISNKDRMG